MGLNPTKGTALGKVVRLPRAAFIGARRALRMRALMDVCLPETTVVIELGSGWGINLLDLFLSGGPRTASYYALEPTESGRECTELLASLEPALRLATLPFDFHGADYSKLPHDNPHVLVFTSHALEQIPELREEAISGLFELGASITGVHFEPIGWQIEENTTGIGATREYSLKHSFNQNLWPLLSKLDSEGEIAIETVVPDILHHKVENASSLVIWHRRAGSVAAA